MYKQRVKTKTTQLKRKWKLQLARSRVQLALAAGHALLLVPPARPGWVGGSLAVLACTSSRPARPLCSLRWLPVRLVERPAPSALPQVGRRRPFGPEAVHGRGTSDLAP